jgi:hypothetical protein
LISEHEAAPGRLARLLARLIIPLSLTILGHLFLSLPTAGYLFFHYPEPEGMMAYLHDIVHDYSVNYFLAICTGYPASCHKLSNYLWTQCIIASGMLFACVILAQQAMAKRSDRFPPLFLALAILLLISLIMTLSTAFVGIWCDNDSGQCSSVATCGQAVFYLVSISTHSFARFSS